MPGMEGISLLMPDPFTTKTGKTSISLLTIVSAIDSRSREFIRNRRGLSVSFMGTNLIDTFK